MLNLFRQGGFIQVVMGGVVVLIIAAFMFTSPLQGGGGTAECAVTVFGECVPAKHFEAGFRLLVPPGMPAKQIKEQGLRDDVLDGLVERELLLREARELGISISDEELDRERALGRIHFSAPAGKYGVARGAGDTPVLHPMLQYIRVRSTKTGDFDFKIYAREVAARTHLSNKDFISHQRAELIASRMREAVAGGVRVSEAEAFGRFERERSTATANVASVNRSWLTRFVTDLSDATLDAFVAKNGEVVDKAYAEIAGDYTADCPLVSELLLEYTPGAPDSEKEQLAERIAELGKRAKKEPFARLVAEASEGNAAEYGGRLGCLGKSYGAAHETLLEAITKLKPGTISEPIETPRGFHLLRLERRLSESELESVGKRHAALPLAATELASAEAAMLAKRIIELTEGDTKLDSATETAAKEWLAKSGAEGEDLEALIAIALAANDKPTVEQSAPFNRGSSPIPSAEAGTAPGALAFALDKPLAVHPAPIATTTGLAVLQLVEKKIASREDFDKEKAELIDALTVQKRAQALGDFVARLRKAAGEQVIVNAAFAEAPDADG